MKSIAASSPDMIVSTSLHPLEGNVQAVVPLENDLAAVESYKDDAVGLLLFRAIRRQGDDICL